ncbi:MAG: TRAP transporter large permease [Myxococcales bacterium]|nr:TRAP transporter large permease [Myxococcales bacterium]
MSAGVAILFVIFALIGAPLFAIFGGAAMVLFHNLPNTSIMGAANDVFSEKFADSPLLVTIPLFTFAGYLMAESGTPHRLVQLSRAWFGWLPGGLAIVCLVASAFFTTFTGGSGITIVAIGGLLYPALLYDRYPEKFSLGLITSGGSLGLLFPPSLPIILYGVVAGVQIEKLFLAGIVPGTLTVVALSVYAVYTGKKMKMKREPFQWGAAFKVLGVAKWEVLLPVVLLGGMYSGLLRIHEAAAFTAIYTLVIEVWIYRDVSFTKDLPRIIRDSMTLVGAILAILATAIGFTSYLIQARVPMMILDMMSSVITSQVMFLICLNLFLIVVGMLMDIFSAIVVVVPLIAPIAERFGVDPYHLGIIFLLNLEIGYLTPPVGLNLFISSFRFEKPITTVYRSVIPFIALLIVALGLTTYVPQLSTWLPDVVYGAGATEVTPLGGPGGQPGVAPTLNELGGGPTAEQPAPDEGTGGGLDELEGEGGTKDSTGGGGLDELEHETGGGGAKGSTGGGGLDELEHETGAGGANDAAPR